MLVKITQRGSLTLPPSVRRHLPSDALFDVVRRDDGVIELRPKVAVDPDQAWFYSERWQKMEKEADADIAEGRVTSYESGEDFERHLEDVIARKRARTTDEA